MSQKIICFPNIDLSAGFSVIKQENNEYVAAVTAVQKTMLTLNKMTMPAREDFENEPQTYDKIQECYSEIQNLTVKFTTKIYSQLEHYPNACIASLGRIDSSLTHALNKVDFIMLHPELKEEELAYEVDLLLTYMDAVIFEAESQINDLNILLKNLTDFTREDVSTIESHMKSILSDIEIETREYNNAKKLLQESKASLEKQINEQIASLVGSIVVSVVAIIIVGLDILAAIITGGAALIALSVVGGLIMVGGTLFAIAFDSYKFVALQNELKSAVSRLNGYETDILLFSEWQEQVSKSAQELVGIREKLTTIQTSWKSVQNGFTTIGNKIREAKGHLSHEEWQNLKVVLEECQTISTDTKTMLESMKIENTQFSDADIVAGMTEEQVAAVIQKSDKRSFKECMLAV